ncbi:MAG: hypothetical protein AAGF86_15175, partial [Pseudomonadota bacterium]
NQSTQAIIDLSVDVLNLGLRPHLTKWQSRFRFWLDIRLNKIGDEDVSLQEIQKEFPDYHNLTTDLLQVNEKLIAYRNTLRKIVFE